MLQIKPEWEREVEIEITEDDEFHNSDPYDFVYSNIPKNTHVLKTVPNCSFCHATKFKYETRENGFYTTETSINCSFAIEQSSSAHIPDTNEF